jgi:spermidine synthase
MQQPKWKKYLSYLTELHLESLSSDFNEELHVYLSKGRYQLCTKNAVYSFDDLYVNFNEAFKQLSIKDKGIEDVLVLGLGLGSIPFMLEKKYDIAANYTAVEIDETIIYLAGKYSLDDLKSPINYVCTDAEIFMSVNNEKYDLICMDIFSDDIIPPQFETIAYLENLRSHLNPNGILLYNRLASLKTDIEKTSHFFDTIFKKVFPNAKYFDVKGNWILVGE